MTDAVAADVARVKAATRAWCEQFVVGLTLCPFARAPMESGTVRVEVCTARQPEHLRRAFLSELDLLQGTPESSLATTLLVFSDALQSFDDYLDFVADAESLLEGAGLAGLVQVASFHPDYQFFGDRFDAPGQFSNRSPFPVIHLLRENMITRAVASYPAPEAIPENNIRLLEALGTEELKCRWEALFAGD